MTVEEADQIIEDVFFDDDAEAVLWNSLSDNDKTKIIYKGTKLIDNLPFLGIQYPGYESMKWPRLIQFAFVDCPYDVKIAILKQALKDKMNSSKEETKLQELGVKTYSIKNASISFNDNNLQGRLQNGVYDTIFREYLTKWVY